MLTLGCTTNREPPLVVAPPKTVVVAPPDALLQDCPPLYTGPLTTHRQLDAKANQAEASSRSCTNDKRALRQWKARSVANATAQPNDLGKPRPQ